MGLKMIKEQRPARCKTAYNGCREKRLTRSGIFFFLQCTQKYFSLNAGRILPSFPLIQGTPRIAGENDDCIPEADILRKEAIRQMSGIKNLEEELYGIEMRFLDFIKKQHTLRVLFYKSRQQAFFSVLIAWFKSDEPQIGLMIRIGRHIKALIWHPQCFSRLLREKRLAYSGRSHKGKYCFWPDPLFIRSGKYLGRKNTFRKSMDNMILPLNGIQEFRPHAANPSGQFGKKMPVGAVFFVALPAAFRIFIRQFGLFRFRFFLRLLRQILFQYFCRRFKKNVQQILRPYLFLISSARRYIGQTEIHLDRIRFVFCVMF